MSKAKSSVQGHQAAKSISKRTDSSGESSFQGLRQKIEGNLKQSEAKSKAKPKAGQKQHDEARGKKRKLSGQVKENARQKKQDRQSEQDIDLKALVVELGGTEEDLDLVNGANSESEMEGIEPTNEQREPKKGKSLESGMANIMKEIALVRDIHYDSDSGEEQPKVNDSAKTQPDADEASKGGLIIKSAAAEVKHQQAQKEKKTKLRCQPRPDWFNHQLPGIEALSAAPQSIEQLQFYARRLLNEENEAFKSAPASSSSQAFYNTVIASGTLSDKISALTLAVQESPLHNMKALEGLIGLAKKRSRSQAVDVLRALKDLFAQGSMLPDRKLCTFAAQPGITAFGQKWREGDRLPIGVQEAHLIVWAYEDWLKEQYFEILKVLETWCNDEIEFAKTRATSYVYELLKEKPEQEANLLRLLINKVGDPVKKIASQASYLIMQLLAHHPAMKEVVISTIDTDFIFKPGQTTHARYYAAVTLNQTALSQEEENIAMKLLDIYFGMFKLLLKSQDEKKKPGKHPEQKKPAAATPSTEQEDDLREKLISAVLTGVNRAYPYSGTEHQAFEAHLDTLFQITHSANFNTSIQAMMLIQQLVSTTAAAGPSSRFYRALYESLLDPRLIASSKQQLYLNLLHRSLKADLNRKRVKAFVKRILQMLSLQEPSFICGAFFLIRDLEKTFPSLAALFDQPEDEDEQHYDPTKRDPAFASADVSCLWDILPYLAHYHPSVSVSVEHLLDRKALSGKPDLTLHTLIHFLDRFVYKNKVSSKMHGSSIMQPVASDTKTVLVSSTGGRQLAVNSAEFLAKKDVSAEDVFFHQYFKNVGKRVSKKEKMEEMGSEEDEDEIWQAMMKSGQDLEGLDEEEADWSDMEGFEEEMQSGGEDVDAMQDLEDEDDSIDVEVGIFDDDDGDGDDDDDDDAEEVENDSDFEGLGDEEEKQPSKKTMQKREERQRKKKLKALPTFASAEEYMKMLEDGEGEDFG